MSADAYTRQTLAGYMHATLAATAQVLGLDLLTSYEEAVSGVALALGSAEPWPQDGRTRALARREAWRVAMQQAAGDSSYSEDNATYNRDQVFAHAREMFDLAVADVDRLEAAGRGGGGGGGGGRNTTAVRVQGVW